MENFSRPSRNRKTASVLLCLLLAGSSLLALAPASLAAISVDDVSPIDGSISTTNPYVPLGANVSGAVSSSVAIDSSTEWLAGTLDENTVVGAAGSLQLRMVNRDDFNGQGDPDANFWMWNNFAVQGQVNGALSLYTDVANGEDQTQISGTNSYALQNMGGLVLSDSVSIVSSGMYMQAFMLGWWGVGPVGSYAGIMFIEDGAGGYLIDFVAYDENFGYQSGSGFSPTHMVNLGSFESYRINVTDAAAGNLTAEWYDANSQVWVDLGTVMLDFANNGPYVPFAGTDAPYFNYAFAFDEFALDIDYIDVGVITYAASGTYESAPLDTGLFPGAFISRIGLVTTNGQFNGIGAVLWRTAPNDTGPWTSYATAPVNVPVDLQSSTWVQIQISLARSGSPSWPDRVEFNLSYKLEVGAYFLDNFPGSGSINTQAWTDTSNTVAGEGLQLDSGSSTTSVGATYGNQSWLLADTHSVKTITVLRAVDGNDVGIGGSGDSNMLLSGFTATDGSSQTGYIGVVRSDDSVDAYWGVVWDDGTGRRTDMRSENMIQTPGQAAVMTTLVDGVFHAWVMELENGWRGWLDLGSFDWGATPGTAWWRIGDIGSHSGSQEVIVDWAAIQLKPLTPVFGAAWTAGNVNINEDQNTRAVIAINGPTWDMQVVDYRLDTTPPSGSMVLNGGGPYTKQLAVDLDLTASDRWGVRYFAASESLSFPEGWQPMTDSTTFSLSPGDGRKVVWVRFQDTSGVSSTPINMSVILDSQNPTGAIYVANRSAYSNEIDVPVTMLAFDGNGVDTLYLSNDATMATSVAYDMNTGATPNLSISSTTTWSLTPGDGTKTVYFRVEDVAGRLSPIYNDSILVDTTAPGLTATLTNGVVRGNTTYVNTNTLRINVEASDASGVNQVDISQDAAFTTFESYTGAGTLTYDVPAVSGAKTVYVRAFDIYGLQSAVRRLDFFVDVNAPTGSIEIVYTGQSMSDFLLNVTGCCQDTGLAKARGVVLVISAVDNVQVAEVEFSTSLYFPGAVWQPFTAGRYWFELSANDGTDKTVYVRFRDVNGNPSQAFFDQIDMDTTPPVGSIIVNSGDISTIDPLLSLSLEGSDNFEGDLQMRLSLTPDFNGSTWLPFADSARFDARTTAGEVTVYFQVRDSNGWESLTYSDKITVRLPTCEETGTCGPVPGAPGFDGAFAVLAIVAVAGLGLAARRRRL